MDRMGQEIAFKGIDLSCQYVPAFSLSAGQHARVNFGQVRGLNQSINQSINQFISRHIALVRLIYNNVLDLSSCSHWRHFLSEVGYHYLFPWEPAGMGKGTPWKCCKVLFVLQMLS